MYGHPVCTAYARAFAKRRRAVLEIGGAIFHPLPAIFNVFVGAVLTAARSSGWGVEMVGYPFGLAMLRLSS